MPLDLDEAARQRALDAFRILDTPPEQAYDDIVRLARSICGVPIALVSLVDGQRQWFKAREGLDAQQTPRDVAFCAHAIREPAQVMEVPDARLDPRFSDNPLVTGAPHIRFYAGAPLLTPEGQALGTVCVIDRAPRRLDPAQREALAALSQLTVSLLVARRRDLASIRGELGHAAAARTGRGGYGVAILQPRDLAGLAAGREEPRQALDRARQALEPLLREDEVLSGHGEHELILLLPAGEDPAVRMRALRESLGPVLDPVAIGMAMAAGADEPMEDVFLRADEVLRAQRGG